MNRPYFSITKPLTLFFVLSMALLVIFQEKLQAKGIDPDVVIIVNLLLFAITMANLYFLSRSIAKANPQAVVRGMMAGSMLKLILLAVAFLIYLNAVGEQRNAPAIYTGMGLYVLYTWLEVRIALRLNRKK
jgi:hypothetical protein